VDALTGEREPGTSSWQRPDRFPVSRKEIANWRFPNGQFGGRNVPFFFVSGVPLPG
jgi:hypothetical protein